MNKRRGNKFILPASAWRKHLKVVCMRSARPNSDVYVCNMYWWWHSYIEPSTACMYVCKYAMNVCACTQNALDVMIMWGPMCGSLMQVFW